MATLGDRADSAEDEVEVDGLALNLDPKVRYYALHKPAGVVTTMRDPQGREDVPGFVRAKGRGSSQSGGSIGIRRDSSCSRTTASWRTP